MKIGELADRADVSAKTVRYYESIGVMAEPPRTPSGYRDYGDDALERLKEWGGDKLAAQMVRLFLKNSGVRMDQIRKGVTEEDHDEAERGAHSLKSSAANVGAESLRALATAIESAVVQYAERYDALNGVGRDDR